jgi:acyl-CoA thioester hydrolase
VAEPFTRKLYVRWSDLDSNGHMKNTAYLDSCVDVRMMYFAAHGFPLREFERLKIGPVVLRDEIDYYRELRLLDPVDVTLVIAGMSEDGSRFRLRNEFFRADGQRAARVASTGGWLDLQGRRLTAPPQQLLETLVALARSEDFEVLESSLR